MSPLSMILSGFSLRYDRWVCGFLIRQPMFSEWKSSLVDASNHDSAILANRRIPVPAYQAQQAAVVRHKPEPVGAVL